MQCVHNDDLFPNLYFVIHVKPIRLQMYQIPPESAKWRVYRAQTDSSVRPIWIEMLYFIERNSNFM